MIAWFKKLHTFISSSRERERVCNPGYPATLFLLQVHISIIVNAEIATVAEKGFASD